MGSVRKFWYMSCKADDKWHPKVWMMVTCRFVKYNLWLTWSVSFAFPCHSNTQAAVKVLFKTHPHSNFQPQHTKVRRTTSDLVKRDNPRENTNVALNTIWIDEGMRCGWRGRRVQVRGTRWGDRRIGGELGGGKCWEQGRANKADAGRVWREKQVGEEHKNTEVKPRANCCAWHTLKKKGKIIV